MSKRSCPAFTLIEVLVVVAIIALLISVLLPSIQNARQQTREVVCRTRLAELYRGHAFYAADAKGRFPHYDWWLWDNTPGTPDAQVNFVHGMYSKWAGARPSDSSTWVEFGQIYRYLKQKEVYFCPCDTKRRSGSAIGGGASGRGNKAIHSFSRFFEPHLLALRRATGNPDAWSNDGVAHWTDFLSPDDIRYRSLVPANGGPPGSFGPFATTPDRVGLLYEEYSGPDDVLRASNTSNMNDQLGDGHSGFWVFLDYAASRHRKRADILYWDGHAAAVDGARYNGVYHDQRTGVPNKYQFQVALGGAK